GIPLPEAEMLAEGIAKDGGTLEQLQHAVGVASTSKLRSPAGFIRAAVRSAVRGAAYLLPDGKPTHASDIGQRPQRIVKALRPIPADWLPGVSHDQARSFCNEAVRLLRLAGTALPSDSEIQDMARQLCQRTRLAGENIAWGK
ncbi:hypothetical protein, partial [Armatimonas sp.]|uniref:hypothetical protein n=1 Tax=Armatimonas sp. TaxID=1872638 RepID=UPI00286BE1B9